MADAPKIPDLADLPDLPGIDREQLALDIAHPQAAEVMAQLFAQENPDAIQEGDPAPHFTLPRLGGPQAGAQVRLADHFAPAGAGRPVALVFGSYT